jgi:hypothetical protein
MHLTVKGTANLFVSMATCRSPEHGAFCWRTEDSVGGISFKEEQFVNDGSSVLDQSVGSVALALALAPVSTSWPLAEAAACSGLFFQAWNLKAVCKSPLRLAKIDLLVCGRLCFSGPDLCPWIPTSGYGSVSIKPSWLSAYSLRFPLVKCVGTLSHFDIFVQIHLCIGCPVWHFVSSKRIGKQVLETGNDLKKTWVVYKRRKIQEINWWV